MDNMILFTSNKISNKNSEDIVRNSKGVSEALKNE